jgi:hypothetical protein
MYALKASKYQKWLGMVNVLLLLSSLVSTCRLFIKFLVRKQILKEPKINSS